MCPAAQRRSGSEALSDGSAGAAAPAGPSTGTGGPAGATRPAVPSPSTTTARMAGARPRLGAASASFTVMAATNAPTTENNAHPISAQRNGNKAAVSSTPAAAPIAAGSNPIVAITVAATATPTADPTCLVALYRAVAAPVCSGATVSKAAACVGMN